MGNSVLDHLRESSNASFEKKRVQNQDNEEEAKETQNQNLIVVALNRKPVLKQQEEE